MKAEQVMGAIGMANMTIRPGDTYVDHLLPAQHKYLQGE